MSEVLLTTDSLKKIDAEVAKYPPDRKQSAVMMALIIAQDEKGWLSSESMDFVAQYLGMPPIAVYEHQDEVTLSSGYRSRRRRTGSR